jgi:predicted DNA-binding protein with PD1-like motif
MHPCLRISLLVAALPCLGCMSTQHTTQPTTPQRDVTIHAFRLGPGKDLLREVQAFARARRIEAGWVVTCVGSLTQTTLRYANQPRASLSRGHFEIVSLVGTVSVNGSHLHLSVSDGEGRTLGGHLMAGNLVYTTAEIVLGESKRFRFRRAKDGTTPWKELQVEQVERLR